MLTTLPTLQATSFEATDAHIDHPQCRCGIAAALARSCCPKWPLDGSRTPLHSYSAPFLKTFCGATEEPELNLAESIRRIVEPFGGIELEIPRREPMEPPPEFDE
jgi:hypothetical protein